LIQRFHQLAFIALLLPDLKYSGQFVLGTLSMTSDASVDSAVPLLLGTEIPEEILCSIDKQTLVTVSSRQCPKPV